MMTKLYINDEITLFDGTEVLNNNEILYKAQEEFKILDSISVADPDPVPF
jgi:hypothetical protein